MKRTRVPRRLAANFVFVFCLFSEALAAAQNAPQPAAAAQAKPLSVARTNICNQLGEAAMCTYLEQDFDLKRNGSTLGDPMADHEAFISRYTLRAYKTLLGTQFEAQAKTLGTQAIQAILLAAATPQAGSSAAASGSTNLVTKPTTTDFISLAAESGAFTDSLNGTSTTLQANALGLVKYFSRDHPIFERWNRHGADLLQPLNFAVTLNVTQSGATTAPTTGTANSTTPINLASVLLPTNNASFDAFTTTYVLYRPYNPQRCGFEDMWNKAFTDKVNQAATLKAATTLAQAVNTMIEPRKQQLLTDPVFLKAADTWTLAATAAEAGNTDADFKHLVAAYAAYQDSFYQVLTDTPDGPKLFLSFAEAYQAYNQANYLVVNSARTTLATVAYVYTASGQKPATHTGKLAFAHTYKGNPDLTTGKGSLVSGLQLTGNFAAELFAQVPAGATYDRLKDVQLSAEMDKPFGGTIMAPRGTLSVAGYGQYQYAPTVLNITAGNLAPGTNITLPGSAQTLLGTAGWLGVVQGKLTIHLASGLDIPVALKYSNKTDLLQGNDIRGQIGISYDLSALTKLINPTQP